MHTWSSEPDAGQAQTIVRGFAQLPGEPDEVMAWLNSDDFYLPGALAFVADYFARHPEVDVVYGHRIVVDEASNEIARWFLPPHDEEVLRLNDFVPQAYFLACFRVHATQKTSARMHDVGQREITQLRERTHSRPFSARELESEPRLLRYLRRSALIEFFWKLGIRIP